MDLSQLEEHFKSALSKGDIENAVTNAVVYCNGCQQVRKYDTAIICLKPLLIKVEKDKSLRAVVLTALGTAYWEKAQLKKALEQFEQAFLLFKEMDDKAGKAAILSIVGLTYWRKCAWDRALEILEDAINQRSDKEDRFTSLYGAFERGISTLHNRIRLGRELEQPLKILQPLFSSSAIYLITGDMENFKLCLDESEVLAKETGQTEILKAILGVSKLAAKVL